MEFTSQRFLETKIAQKSVEARLEKNDLEWQGENNLAYFLDLLEYMNAVSSGSIQLIRNRLF